MLGFVSSIPEASLTSWYRVLTISAIGLPIVGAIMGGICGWFAFGVSDRIGALQSATILQQDGQISHLTGDLKIVRNQADQLAIKAQNAERGISDTYDFNGAHRQTLGGRIEVTTGPEIVVFQNILAMNSKGSWIELRDLCDQQIQKTPRWLTPYLYSGLAYANIGDLVKAEDRLSFVVNEAGNDPRYSDASRILSDIKLMLSTRQNTEH